ncbi:MAG: hypothetical protein U5K51_14245 [Flavobacteriaceae bacterium]|nr:hypothetical protein [Flavobacteriaceae bacterium]
MKSSTSRTINVLMTILVIAKIIQSLCKCPKPNRKIRNAAFPSGLWLQKYADILKEQGVASYLQAIWAMGALNVLTNHGIDVYRGCSGDVAEIAGVLLGDFADSGKGCRSHEHHGRKHQV